MNLPNKRLLVGQFILQLAAAIGLLPDHLRAFIAVDIAILGAYFWVSALIPVNGKEDE